ncbi:MAG TPA: sigma-70 family RNA polymerase sigma factor [Pirellulales bacterium]|nr:sigma-70 family RNA polymerase sigma factor [Pirellulales bacterium]
MAENEMPKPGINPGQDISHIADQAAAQDPATRFIELLTAHQRDMFIYINTLLMGDSSAIDVLQDTNLDLWARLKDFDNAQPFLPWAYGFAFQRVLAFRKSRRRSRMVLSDEMVQIISDTYVRDSTPADTRLVALRSCLEKLDSEQGRLIRERYVEKMSVKTIAARLGQTTNQISARLYRIRHSLGRCIQTTLIAEVP